MAGSPIDRVLDALRAHGSDPRRNESGWSAKCPAHSDESPSLSVDEGEDGCALMYCHAGCATEAIASGLGLTTADLFRPKPVKRRREILATYDYTDENGELIFQAVKYSGGEPRFHQRHPDGHGGWVWNLKGVPRVLYALPLVRATADAGGTIYVCEGEKDADAAALAGVCATTNPMGAGEWKPAYSESLQGASRVVVVADRDDADRKHARQVAASVSEHVAEVTIVEPVTGNDLSDHLNAGHTIDDLVPVDTVEPDVVSRALPEPVAIDGTTIDGAALLDELHDTIIGFVIWPEEAASIAYMLWVAATHGQQAWEHATRFALKSPIKRCGKTRVEEIGRELVHRPLPTANVSPAALTRSIDEDDPPTIIIDEADTIFGKGKNTREGAEDLRGILNAGHSRGWPYLRWDMKAKQLDECSTFAMAMLAGIGDLPDTIEDRAVVVSMRRRASGEQVRPFRRRRVLPELHDLRDRLHAWVTAYVADLGYAEPDVPVEDRQADVWEPLMAVADLAGGYWPDRARAACRVMCSVATDDEGTLGERLLADLRDIWGDEDHLPTATILERLHGIEEAPWSDYYGKPLAARGLAKLLKPYGVRSVTFRLNERETPKGYARSDLVDPWRRYATGATPQQDGEIPDLTSEDGRCAFVAEGDSGTATGPDQGERTEVADVADVAEERSDRAISPDEPGNDGARVSQTDIDEAAEMFPTHDPERFRR